MAKSKKTPVDRRNFLKGAVGGAAALAVDTGAAEAQRAEPARSAATPLMAKESDPGPLSKAEVLTEGRSGSDYMVDVLQSLGFEYVCANPGSSFRALHESLINYGGNKPELITCCHEESSVAMAHGYSKIEGKPACVFAHGTVGLQHASMAIYNAFCDRAPVYMIIGNTIDATMRRPGAEWDHSVQDAVAMVRDFVKWDDLPISLAHFGESAVRAYKIAMTAPTLPVVVVADSELQERPVPEGERLRVPKLTLTAPPQGDSGAVAEAARLLVGAESPVLIADRAARTPAGLKLLIELAETLQASVVNQMGRMNFPTRHPLNQTERSRAAIANADVILGLEVADFWGAVNSMRDQLHRTSRLIAKPDAKLITITAGDLFTKSNYQDFQRYPEVDVAIAADAEATLASLIEACKRLITSDRKRAFEERGRKLAELHQEALDKARTEATYGWDASPISTARLYTELWAQIQGQDWSLVSDAAFSSGWPLRLWNFDKHYQYIGGSGGAGIGYGAPAAVGAALANRKHGRLSVNVQNDGDLMYAPGILWTAAHHRIPLLSLMHNNRAYHMEMMHLQRMANRHQRGIDRTGIGVTLNDPNIDYAQIGRGMGVHAEGPIADPKDLGPAIGRALAVVRSGEPALIDVVTQPR
ncbi:MAG: thiamine pyrophosphate-binding protein [Acidobacteriia bacterium]|nr:thiamine pyrophosphate-binding protein [Terriglobia bacterium]